MKVSPAQTDRGRRAGPYRSARKRLATILASIGVLVFLAALSGCGPRADGPAQGYRVGEVTFGFTRPAVWSAKSDVFAIADRDRIKVYEVSRIDRPRLRRNLKVANLVGIDWSPDGRNLLAEVDDWRLFGDRGNKVLLIDARTWRRRAVPGLRGQDFFWLNKSEIGYFTIPGESLDEFNLIGYKLGSGEKRPIIEKTKGFAVVKTLPNKRLLVRRAMSAMTQTIQAIDLSSGRRRRLFSGATEVAVADSGRAVVLLRPRWIKTSSGVKELIAFPAHLAQVASTRVKVGKRFEIVDEKKKRLSLSSISLSPDGKILTFEALEPGKAKLYVAKIE